MTVQNKFTKRGAHFTGWRHIVRMSCDGGTMDEKKQVTYAMVFKAEHGYTIRMNLTRLDLHNILQVMEGIKPMDVSPNQLSLWLTEEKEEKAKGAPSALPLSSANIRAVESDSDAIA